MVCRHTLAHVQDERRGVRPAGFRSVDHEVARLEVQRDTRLPLGRLSQRLRQVETKRIAEVIRLRLVSENTGLARGSLPRLPDGNLRE